MAPGEVSVCPGPWEMDEVAYMMGGVGSNSKADRVRIGLV